MENCGELSCTSYSLGKKSTYSFRKFRIVLACRLLALAAICTRRTAPAGRSSWVTLLGTTAGIIGKLSIGLLMILWFLVAAFVA